MILRDLFPNLLEASHRYLPNFRNVNLFAIRFPSSPIIRTLGFGSPDAWQSIVIYFPMHPNSLAFTVRANSGGSMEKGKIIYYLNYY